MVGTLAPEFSEIEMYKLYKCWKIWQLEIRIDVFTLVVKAGPLASGDFGAEEAAGTWLEESRQVAAKGPGARSGWYNTGLRGPRITPLTCGPGLRKQGEIKKKCRQELPHPQCTYGKGAPERNATVAAAC